MISKPNLFYLNKKLVCCLNFKEVARILNRLVLHLRSLEDYLSSEILTVFLSFPSSWLMQYFVEETLSMKAEGLAILRFMQYMGFSAQACQLVTNTLT